MASPLFGYYSQISNIESDNSQNGGLEDYNNTSDEIFPHFTTPYVNSLSYSQVSIKRASSLGIKRASSFNRDLRVQK